MQNKTTILVVEDEPAISNFISATLTANGYRCIVCEKGVAALSLIASHNPDIILLDLGLPDMDGIEVLKELRTWSMIPVIVVSARDKEKEKVQALDLGADDYITKPFGTAELIARIRTAIRHYSRMTEKMTFHIFKVKDMVIDYDRHRVTIGGKDIHLTQIEFKLVSLLSQSAGKVLTYDYLLTNIWGPYSVSDNQILRVNMANIRRKIEKNPGSPQYIFTEVGVGYRMTEGDK